MKVEIPLPGLLTNFSELIQASSLRSLLLRELHMLYCAEKYCKSTKGRFLYFLNVSVEVQSRHRRSMWTDLTQSLSFLTEDSTFLTSAPLTKPPHLQWNILQDGWQRGTGSDDAGCCLPRVQSQDHRIELLTLFPVLTLELWDLSPCRAEWIWAWRTDMDVI